MSRLPQLEAALVEAAGREAERAGSPPPDRVRRTARRPWGRRGLAALIAALTISGVSVAATTGLLSSGPPVPDAAPAKRLPLVAQSRTLTPAAVRVPDADGGPPWAVATYRATDRGGAGALTCVVVGRIQDGQLGVVGRDGVFGDDGRFHALSPRTFNQTACGGGRGPIGSLGPPIPASGYTGPSATSIGGCRERVDLDGPTVSPQTRRKLRGVPECARSSLRMVVAGLGGPAARRAVVTGRGIRRTQSLHPADSGAYLFVLPGGATDVRVRVTDARGQVLLDLPGRPRPPGPPSRPRP